MTDPIDEEILEDPFFQGHIIQAVKTLEIIAKVSDDNRGEIPFSRKDGTKMIIVIEEEKKYHRTLPHIEGLDTALLNATKPVYDENSGEWVLYCGEEHHAKAILQSAALVAKQMGKTDEKI